MSPAINVQSLVKRYKKADKNAVDDISFSVKKGELFALLGPNGAGKTTTVAILTTVLSKTSGQVTVAGFNIQNQSSKVRERIGVIFQSPSLDKNLTAEENIRFHANLYNLYPFRPFFSLMPDSYKKRVFDLADILGIKDDIFKPIKTYSGGMKRKLEIIRGLMHNPSILFLDEPTTGLDPLSRKSLWDYLGQVRKKEKTTIFLTTHYLEEAEEADHIAIINKGKLVSEGTPQKIKSDLVEEYLILDAKDRGALSAELKSLNLKFSKDTPFKAGLNGKSAQSIISRLRSRLTVLRIHKPTLEQAYLEIINSSNNESST